MVSCHPVPRPVIHRDLQPESVSSSDSAKVMHCPFLKEFLRWKAVEPCKTRTGIVDLLDTLIFLFLMLLLNYIWHSFKVLIPNRKIFTWNHLESFPFFQVLVEDTSRDEGSSTATGILHSDTFLVIFQLLPKPFQAWKPGLLALVCRKGCGVGVWWRVQNSFCDVSFAIIVFSLGSFCASTFPWNMN